MRILENKVTTESEPLKAADVKENVAAQEKFCPLLKRLALDQLHCTTRKTNNKCSDSGLR